MRFVFLCKRNAMFNHQNSKKMKKRLFLVFLLLAILGTCPYVVADGPNPDPLIFLGPFGPGDDNGTGNQLPKAPVMPPTVGINGHTLYLYNGCDNTEIVLIGENETEVYSTYVLEGTTQVQLPSALQGTYELRILRGQYMFYTEIEL